MWWRLEARLANLETTTDTAERDGAVTAGARLGRGFTQLLAQAENSSRANGRT
jgi:hypothetical protein